MGNSLSGFLYCFLLREVLITALLVGYGLIGLAQLSGTLLLVLDHLLKGGLKAFLPDGIESPLDMYQDLLGGPF